LAVVYIVQHFRTNAAMRLTTFSVSFLLSPTTFHFAEASEYTTKHIYQFPNGTWIENLAVRSDGNLLLSLVAPCACLYSLDPIVPKGEPTLVHNFTESHGLSSLLGITEGTHERFYVVAENYSYVTNTVDAGSINVFRVDFSSWRRDSHSKTEHENEAKISLVVNLKDASFLDGLAAHPLNSSLLLAADPALGQTFAINTETGHYTTGIKDELMAAPEGAALEFGINGLHVGDAWRTLYFTNSVRPALARIAIAMDGGPAAASSSAEKIADDSPYSYDDFALSPGVSTSSESRYVYAVTSNGNSVQRVDLSSGSTDIIAGSVNSTLMAEPSACQFGRTEADKGWLYVTTAGGIAEPVDGNIIVGGQVVGVYVGEG
jgi:hypothetical protein